MTDQLPAKRGRGRPPGSLNKTTLARKALAEGALDQILDHLQAVTNVVVERALDGDMSAAKTVQEITTAPDTEFKVVITNNLPEPPKAVEGVVVEATVTHEE